LEFISAVAVKKIEIACCLVRRDGSHLADRRRIIPDTVYMKSRKLHEEPEAQRRLAARIRRRNLKKCEMLGGNGQPHSTLLLNPAQPKRTRRPRKCDYRT
jgi:hypothetical protein